MTWEEILLRENLARTVRPIILRNAIFHPLSFFLQVVDNELEVSVNRSRVEDWEAQVFSKGRVALDIQDVGTGVSVAIGAIMGEDDLGLTQV